VTVSVSECVSTLLLASAANLSATMTSEARKSWTPFSAAIFSSLRANSSCGRELWDGGEDEVRDCRRGERMTERRCKTSQAGVKRL
jgi:hypothetical protein